MRINHRPVTPKTPKAERNFAHMAKVKNMDCIIYNGECYGETEVHHCFTGSGGRKNDSKVLPLCFNHHRHVDGIHSIGRKKWQEKYGSEAELLQKTQQLMIMQENIF